MPTSTPQMQSDGAIAGPRTALPRVLFVDHTGVLGGAELCLGDIAGHFGSRCRVVLFADGPFARWLEREGVEHEVLEAAGALHAIKRDRAVPSLAALPAIVRTVRTLAREARGYDVVYANSQKAFVIAALASPLSRRPLVWHLHDILEYESFSRVNIAADIFLANHAATAVIANSQACAEAFVARGGKRELVHVVYNGFDTSVASDVSRVDLARLRRELDVRDAPVLAVFGRLAPWKGQEIALRALVDIPGAILLVVGDALFGEAEYARSLHVLAESLGIAERVRFLGFRTDIPQLMQVADVVLHTSVRPEPFGRVIVEAMLAERPVIATSAGGALEIVESDVTGVLVAPGDPAALAAAAIDLLARPERAQRMGAAGRARAMELFSLHLILPKIVDIVAAAAHR